MNKGFYPLVFFDRNQSFVQLMASVVGDFETVSHYENAA